MAGAARGALFSQTMAYYLGVDAGGTRTRAVLAAANGTVLGTGSAGPGNWQAIGATAASAAVSAAVNAALAQAAVAVAGRGADATGADVAAAVRGAFFGLAGVRTEAERAVMRDGLTHLETGGVRVIGGDLEVAHAGALGGGPGVVVIAGTGSAAWGRNGLGRTWQAGGWGWLVDDKGGGYWLALRGLAAACEAEDGRSLATTLGARATAYFGAADLRAILRDLHAVKMDRAMVAGFAREVRAAAGAGDAVARGLEAEAGRELLRLAEAVRDGLLAGNDHSTGGHLRLAVTGGLGLGPMITDDARSRGFALCEPWAEPAYGAVLLAARAAGAELDAAARERLRGAEP